MERIEFDKLPNYRGIKTLTYAGLGSRRTPKEIMLKMNRIAKRLEELGYILHSGGALGADKAFEGAPQPFTKERNVITEWASYKHIVKQKIIFKADQATDRTRTIAKEIHPAPNRLSGYVLDLQARNTFQIFGINLDTTVDFIICWTPNGMTSHDERTIKEGGTAQAISMASLKGIPVINMANDDYIDRIKELIYN